MFNPMCCLNSAEKESMHKNYQMRKMSMLKFWKDGLEQQLASINATINKIQEQIDRDTTQ